MLSMPLKRPYLTMRTMVTADTIMIRISIYRTSEGHPTSALRPVPDILPIQARDKRASIPDGTETSLIWA